MHRRPGRSRKQFTTAGNDRFIVSTTLRNRYLNDIQVLQQLSEIRRVATTQWTVRQRLKRRNLTPKSNCGWSKTVHSQARLLFARDHLNWTLAQCSFLRWTGIYLCGSDQKRKVYRRLGKRFDRKFGFIKYEAKFAWKKHH